MAIINNIQANQFESVIDGHTAFLEYKNDGHTLQLIHTNVPPELSGRGIGGELVRHAIAYAAENDLKVIAICSYALAWIEKHQSSNS